MENVLLIVHLILALCLIGVVLLQRSEGGGLGMGSGGGGGTGVMSSRAAATAMGKMTWIFAIAFICTSLLLTVMAARNSADSSVLDRLGADAPAAEESAPASDTPNLLPPITPSTETPVLPPRAE